MRVKTLTIILFLFLIPDFFFIVYFASEPAMVQSLVEAYVPRWMLGGLSDNPVAILVFGAFLYVIIFGSALLYVLVSNTFKKLGRSNEY